MNTRKEEKVLGKTCDLRKERNSLWAPPPKRLKKHGGTRSLGIRFFRGVLKRRGSEKRGGEHREARWKKVVLDQWLVGLPLTRGQGTPTRNKVERAESPVREKKTNGPTTTAEEVLRIRYPLRSKANFRPTDKTES